MVHVSHSRVHSTRDSISPTPNVQYNASSSSVKRRGPPAIKPQPPTLGGGPEDWKVPHCGYHYDGSARRFFEGWYWRVQLPGTQQSFALIFSIEDPGSSNMPVGSGTHTGLGIQVMGPDDGYICQYDSDTSTFWADRNELALGSGLRSGPGPFRPPGVRAWPSGGIRVGSILPSDSFFQAVKRGFQASYTQQSGSIVSNETGAAGAPMSTVPSCTWDFKIQPISGWGPEGGSQKATAGWLSVLSVFEPHWQVLMSHGLATGWFEWGGKRYEFNDAPSYSEKNWGGGFPSKWCWVQCNSFDGYPGLSVTAVGARRMLAQGIPILGGIEEDVGMIGIHLPPSATMDGKGVFLELVPWAGEVEWNVEPWGRWYLEARCGEYEAILEATCQEKAGTMLRAPTISQGLAPFCRDTFFGKCRLRVWKRASGSNAGVAMDGNGGGGGGTISPIGGRKGGSGSLPSSSGRQLVVDASTTTAALEVGGGPWWGPWSAKAAMKEPLRTLVQAPIDLGKIREVVPGPIKPPGL